MMIMVDDEDESDHRPCREAAAKKVKDTIGEKWTEVQVINLKYFAIFGYSYYLCMCKIWQKLHIYFLLI